MKTAVASTSLRSYDALQPDLTACQRRLIAAMKPGRIYSRRELETASGMRTGSVCGRVFELIEAGQIEVIGEKVCAESGKQVEALRLVARQLELLA